MRPGRRQLAVVALATGVAVLISMALVEAWVRLSWDHRRGSPGFFLSDPELGLRLAPGYEGWFAGVPVRINRLGFRDPREYSVDKAPGTFRILVIGDSVTFGHGAAFETTYPYLLEERLRAWKPDVRWEVWNLGVPGLNTRQEARYLERVAPRFDPDLAVVGFFVNDFVGNEEAAGPTWLRRAASALQRVAQRNAYSYEFYKRAYLTLRWHLFTDLEDRLRLEHLEGERELFAAVEPGTGAGSGPALASLDYFDEEDVRSYVCTGAPHVDPSSAGWLSQRIEQRTPDIVPWLDAVADLKQVARAAGVPLVFFINMAPEICPDQDRFYKGGALADEAVLLKVLGEGASAASVTQALLHYRPSQMPDAGGHSLANANRVKAGVLFEHLRGEVLPGLLGHDRSH